MTNDQRSDWRVGKDQRFVLKKLIELTRQSMLRRTEW